MKHVVEFRDEAGELTVGETVTVDAFEVGQTVKVSGTSKGKGFQGTHQASPLRPRPQVATARTTSARPARSARRPRPRAS